VDVTAPTVPPPAHPRIRVVPPDPADAGSFRAGQLELLAEVAALANQLGALSAPRVRSWVEHRRAELVGGGGR
jgi:hypothetical protein